jgi:hypothetical protein
MMEKYVELHILQQAHIRHDYIDPRRSRIFTIIYIAWLTVPNTPIAWKFNLNLSFEDGISGVR